VNKEVMFSSATGVWATPQDFFDSLDAEFNFTLDPCANDENHKCEKYFTEAEDGLAQDWAGERVFCNPPYSRRTKGNPGQEAWIKKAAEEGQRPGAVGVMLIPARTDTLAFHKYIYHKAEIRFVKGHLRFRVNGKPGDAAPFTSMVVIFRGPKAERRKTLENQDYKRTPDRSRKPPGGGRRV